MRACLHSLSLVYCPLILSNSDSGVFTQRPNSSHCSSLMTSRTLERFSGVRLDSGNTTGEMTGGERDRERNREHTQWRIQKIQKEGSTGRSLDGRRPSSRGERGRVASLTPDLFCRPENGGTNQYSNGHLVKHVARYVTHIARYVTPLRLILFMTSKSDYIMLYATNPGLG